ncbi:ADP-ribosylation factor-like protein 16 [Oscarella lobularis]|uniref:ADP-ribosylation factor-like protein 16 n=1 Tax=Oscarella lobularis TaxID=121494 RepID=UPI003313600F
MTLLLGAKGVGKTLLLKQLRAIYAVKAAEEDDEAVPATIATIGTNLVSFTVGKEAITVREMGGAMAPIWSSCFEDAQNVLFMFDLANRQQTAASCILLLELISSPELQKARFLLLFNKIDIERDMRMTIIELSSLIRLDDIVATSKQDVSFTEISARNKTNLDVIVDWIAKGAR